MISVLIPAYNEADRIADRYSRSYKSARFDKFVGDTADAAKAINDFAAKRRSGFTGR